LTIVKGVFDYGDVLIQLKIHRDAYKLSESERA